MSASRSHQRALPYIDPPGRFWSAVSACTVTVFPHMPLCVSFSRSEHITRRSQNHAKTDRERRREGKKGEPTGVLSPSLTLSPSVAHYLSSPHSSLISYLFGAARSHRPCHGISCLLSAQILEPVLTSAPPPPSYLLSCLMLQHSGCRIQHFCLFAFKCQFKLCGLLVMLIHSTAMCVCHR